MTFAQAYSAMKQGKRVKMPEWGGYWYWDNDKNTIIIHTHDNKELDIRSTENVEFTLSFIVRDDWELIQ